MASRSPALTGRSAASPLAPTQAAAIDAVSARTTPAGKATGRQPAARAAAISSAVKPPSGPTRIAVGSAGSRSGNGSPAGSRIRRDPGGASASRFAERDRELDRTVDGREARSPRLLGGFPNDALEAREQALARTEGLRALRPHDGRAARRRARRPSRRSSRASPAARRRPAGEAEPRHPGARRRRRTRLAPRSRPGRRARCGRSPPARCRRSAPPSRPPRAGERGRAPPRPRRLGRARREPAGSRRSAAGETQAHPLPSVRRAASFQRPRRTRDSTSLSRPA